jgi:nitronate monooxygenase
MWPDRRIVDLFKIEHPILLGPMAGAVDFALAVAVAKGGGLGAIPCAMLTAEQLREVLGKYRSATQAPVNVNFSSVTRLRFPTMRARCAGASG